MYCFSPDTAVILVGCALFLAVPRLGHCRALTQRSGPFLGWASTVNGDSRCVSECTQDGFKLRCIGKRFRCYLFRGKGPYHSGKPIMSLKGSYAKSALI